MLTLKIAVRLACLRQPFRKALETAARLGAEAVEIDARTEVRPAEMSQSAIRHLRKTIDDFNLRVAAVSFQTRHGYHVLENLDRRIEATRQAMQFAYQLGAPVVLNQVGQVPADTDDPQWDQLVQALTYCSFLQCLQPIALVNLNDCRFQARNTTPWLNRKQIEDFPPQML